VRYAALSRAAGNDVEFISVPRAGHGMEVMPGSINNQIFRQSALQFLQTRGLRP
jgi:hypothetical protein